VKTQNIMPKRPHILLITSDQHRADTLGCAAHPCVRTPHLDQLAYEGVRFDKAYVDCPICIPARTTLITGIQSHVYGMPSYAPNYRIERPREGFLGSLLTQAGYQTQLIGKTHWHTPGSFRAGFENIIGLGQLNKQRTRETKRGANLHGLGANELSPSDSLLPPHLHASDWIVDRCVEVLETREQEQPLFLWASFIAPHPPLCIHEPYYSMYDHSAIPEAVMPSWIDEPDCPLAQYEHRWAWNSGPLSPDELRKARAVYYGLVTNLDHQLGRLFGTMMKQGMWDDTLVIYSSDHGEMLGDLGDVGKMSFYEASARVPFIVRPPLEWQTEPGRVQKSLIEWADVLPTLCEVARVEAPGDVTGRSILPLVRGEAERIRDTLHGQIDNSHMMHDGRYKYLYGAADGSEQLFDTDQDPHDEHPLHDAERMAALREAFAAHLRDEGHAHWQDGQVLNLGRDKAPRHRLRAQNPGGWRGAAG
jgi:arylsulfatase A-like enzyme